MHHRLELFELHIPNGRLPHVFPRAVGDLYAGHELMLVGRYTNSEPIQLTLTGQRRHEREEHSFRFNLAAPARTGNADTIGRLWAARKIGYLIDEIRLGSTSEVAPDPVERQDDPRISEIVRLGTRYGILTEYTSFLAGEGTDLYAFAENVKRCTAEIEGRTNVVAGAHGVAQACNTKMMQRSGQVAKSNTWVGANGQQVTVEGVSCVNGKTFFRRGDTWLDAALAGAEADETIELYSEEFFALLDLGVLLCFQDEVVALEGRGAGEALEAGEAATLGLVEEAFEDLAGLLVEVVGGQGAYRCLSQPWSMSASVKRRRGCW